MAIESVELPSHHPFLGMDLNSALAERVQLRGDHPFLIWEPAHGSSITWTYRQFAEEVAAVAAGLAERGVRQGDAVAVHLDNCPAFLLMLFACGRLGAVAVNVNARFSEPELRRALGVTAAVGIVTTANCLPMVASDTALKWSLAVDDDGRVSQLLGEPTSAPSRAPDPAMALAVQFTSGSTSFPKAVVLTHANALWAGKVGSSHWALRDTDVQLVYPPLFHTSAMSWQSLATFWVGGTVVLVPKFSASRFWAVSLKHRCTHTFLLGISMTLLAEQEVPEHSYRSWAFGLEVPPIEDRYKVRIFPAWGMTETVTTVIVGDALARSDFGAIGRASPSYEVLIEHDEGRTADAGEEGTLLVRGVRGLSVFARYHGDPEATANAFDERGYFRTGDRVSVLASGCLKYAGRTNDMLKVGGENVAAIEIERVLMGVAGVDAAGVVGQPDRILDEVPVAFVVLKDGADPTGIEEQLIEHCRANLADFKVPRAVYIVNELPRATLDKIAKAPLKARALELMKS
jgi:crotonobetaine/carnitine-CoA ligase